MKRHRRQARQLYDALLEREQTWTRPTGVIDDEWATAFEELERDVGDRKRIQQVLDWYCDHGCGALYVPMIGNAEGFRTKFEQLAKAMDRLDGQRLRHFDDLIQYEINERRGGTTAQKECSRVMQRVQQQVDFVDDLANGRHRLPALKASLRNGKAPPKATRLTEAERELASKWVLVSRDYRIH